MRGLIIGAATALTTGMAAKAVTDFASRADEIGRTARMLGLSAEGWQELSYAAKMADLESTDLATAFKKMNANLGELRTKGGALYSYLKDTNPELAYQLSTVEDSDTAFTSLMYAIAKETNVTKRAALAQAAFGKTGQNLIEMSGNLAEMRKEAQTSGGILTDKEVAAGERLEDSLKRMKIAGGGIVNGVLARAAAIIAPLVEKAQAWVQANRELINTRIDQFLGTIGKVCQIIAWAWKSGIIPAILIGVGVFKGITLAIQLWTAAQTLLNTVMSANPIGLIIIAVAALAAGAFLLIKHWDKVKSFFGMLWEGIKVGASVAWDFLKAGFFTVADIILSTVGNVVKGVMWAASQIGGALGFDVSGLNATIDQLTKLQNDVRAQSAFGPAVAGTPVSPNAGVVSSNITTNRNSTLDVNFRNTPPGTDMKQAGAAPGITVNTMPTMDLGYFGI